MWRRNFEEKQPTPVTVSHDTPVEPPAAATGAPLEEEKESSRNEINMFDELNNNIGEISVYNEKDDISCLFNSFLNP